MSGYYLAFGSCIGCGRPFSFNPELVPSSSAVTGKREPICPNCLASINAYKREHGMPEWTPPRGAYEPAPEMPDGEPWEP